jgi:hypothetical protein
LISADLGQAVLLLAFNYPITKLPTYPISEAEPAPDFRLLTPDSGFLTSAFQISSIQIPDFTFPCNAFINL